MSVLQWVDSWVFIPTQVDCLGMHFTVEFVPRDELDGCEGDVEWETSRIRIANDLAPLPAYSTLWHEYLHIVEWIFGYSLGEKRINLLTAVNVNHRVQVPYVQPKMEV